MAGAGVLLTVELNAGTSICLKHEAIVRTRRRNPALHRRSRIQGNERIGRISHHRRVNRDAGRYSGVTSNCKFTPGRGSAHCIYIDRAARVYVVEEQRQRGFLDLRRGQSRGQLSKIELNQSDASGAAYGNSGRCPEVTAIARHVVDILRWGQGLREARDGRQG